MIVSRWEVEGEDWDRVRDGLMASITEVARNKSLIAYSDLIRDVPEIEGPQSHALAEMLGEIGQRCHSEGLPLLSALVVNKDTGMPGPGFFEAAVRLKLLTSSNARARDEFWLRQVKSCYQHHWER